MVVAVLAIITLCIWIGWAAVNNYWWGEDSKREMRERLRVLPPIHTRHSERQRETARQWETETQWVTEKHRETERQRERNIGGQRDSEKQRDSERQ